MIKSLDEITFIDKDKILGEGAFSEVFKVKRKSDGKLFALKKVDLNLLEKEDMINLDSEIKLHQKVSHPNIIKFISHFKDQQSLYFVLEYAGNSCLFFYIHSVQGLPEKLALRFFYQTALAVQHLHKYNLIHRDIKPENILLDTDFNIKLCDFGWSCFLENDAYRTSICGTYEYMSPEIIYGKSHTNKVDVWCMGILLYEMLHGNPPFKADTLRQIKDEFMTKNILLRKALSQETKDLLKNVLKTDDKKRYTIDQILEHPAIKNNIKEFNEPLTEQDFSILVKNYMLNSDVQGKRILPDAFEDLVHLIQSPFKAKMDIQKLLEENKYNPEDTVTKNTNQQPQTQQEVDNSEIEYNFQKKDDTQKVIIQTVQQKQQQQQPIQNIQNQQLQNIQTKQKNQDDQSNIQKHQQQNESSKSQAQQQNIQTYKTDEFKNNDFDKNQQQTNNKTDYQNQQQTNIRTNYANQNINNRYQLQNSQYSLSQYDKNQYNQNQNQQYQIYQNNYNNKPQNKQINETNQTKQQPNSQTQFSNIQQVNQNYNKIVQNKDNSNINLKNQANKMEKNQQKEVYKNMKLPQNPFKTNYKTSQITKQEPIKNQTNNNKQFENKINNNEMSKNIQNNNNKNDQQNLNLGKEFNQRLMQTNFGSSKYISLPANQFGIKIVKKRSQSRKKTVIKIDITQNNKNQQQNPHQNFIVNPPIKPQKRQVSQHKQKHKDSKDEFLHKSHVGLTRNYSTNFQQQLSPQQNQEVKTVTRRISLWKN